MVRHFRIGKGEPLPWQSLDRSEAEHRLLDAANRGDLLARIEDDVEDEDNPVWFLELPDAKAEAIARRYLDMPLKRRSRDES